MTTKKSCKWCPDPPKRGKSLCDECEKKAQKYRKDLKAERTKNKECYRCGSKLTEQDILEAYASCTGCRTKDAKRKQDKLKPVATQVSEPDFTIPEL